MPVPREHEDVRQLRRRSPLPGLAVGRFVGGGPLLRAIPERYGTSFHLTGHSQWTSGRARWSSGPGTISIKTPGDVTIERARSGRPDFQVVLFDAVLVDDARAALDRPAVVPRDHVIEPGDPRTRPLAELHQRLLAADDRAPGLEHAMCAAVAAFVELTSAPRGSVYRSSAFSVPVARARAMLDEQLAEAVTLDALADHARLDKFQLCRAFRDEVGLPPHAYVTHRRVARAQELLARGVAQAEVAARVGLYDQSLLHRHFKRIVGVTPGAFTRSLR